VTLFSTVAYAMAGVLLWAALGKVRDLAPLASTIRKLGAPQPLARPAAGFVTSAELAVAVALLFRPDSLITQFGVLALAGLFALAGLRALALHERIPCSCFCSGDDLGIRQLLAMLVWIGGMALVHFGVRQPPSAAVGAASFAVIALGIAAVRTVALWKSGMEARGDRRSAERTYIWLPSH